MGANAGQPRQAQEVHAELGRDAVGVGLGAGGEILIDDEPMEMIVLPDKIVQLFQWEHRTRFLWTDGREAPSGENLENWWTRWKNVAIPTTAIAMARIRST